MRLLIAKVREVAHSLSHKRSPVARSAIWSASNLSSSLPTCLVVCQPTERMFPNVFVSLIFCNRCLWYVNDALNDTTSGAINGNEIK